LRADRMLLAALEATLRLYRNGRARELPALLALHASPVELRQRATRLALLLQEKGIACSVVDCEGRVGGGSLPQRKLEGAGIAIDADPGSLLAALREGEPPVISVVRDGRVVLDVRCVQDVDELAEAIAKASGRATARKGDTVEGISGTGAAGRLLREQGDDDMEV
jgi:L-seryl-tRNA(Ser) seleniumtransferase